MKKLIHILTAAFVLVVWHAEAQRQIETSAWSRDFLRLNSAATAAAQLGLVPVDLSSNMAGMSNSFAGMSNSFVTISNTYAALTNVNGQPFDNYMINGSAFLKAAKAYQGNGNFKILMLGDSTSLDDHGGPAVGLLSSITNTLPLHGYVSMDTDYLSMFGSDAERTAYYNQIGNTNFFCSSWDMQAGCVLTNQGYSSGWVGLPGNKYTIFYIAEPGAGSFNIYDSTNTPDSYQFLASVNADAATYHLVATNFYVPLMNHKFKLVCTSSGTLGHVSLWNFAGLVNTNGHGVILERTFLGGHRAILEMLAMNPGNAATILASLDPDLILFEQKNDLQDDVWTNIVPYTELLTNYCTNADICWETTHQIDFASDPSLFYKDVTNNYTMKTNAIAFGQAIFDNYGYFGSYSNLVSLGMTFDWYHGNAVMGVQKGKALWSRIASSFGTGADSTNFIGQANLWGSASKLKTYLDADRFPGVPVGYESDPLKRDLQVWLPYDEGQGEKSIDETGHGFDVTCSLPFAWQSGRIWKGIAATNANFAPALWKARELNITNAVTLSCWVNSTFAWDSSSDEIFVYRMSSGTNGDWMLDSWPNATKIQATFVVKPGGVPTAATAIATVAAWNDGAWHHVAATYDQTNIDIYYDGQLSGSAALSGPLNNYMPNFSGMPGILGPGKTFFEDDVRIYSRALSANDIDRLYQQGTNSLSYQP